MSTRGEALCAVPIRLLRCGVGATWALHWWIVDAINSRVIFERTPLPQARMRFFNFVHSMKATAQDIPLDKPAAPFAQQLL